jgi:hypothetical protein
MTRSRIGALSLLLPWEERHVWLTMIGNKIIMGIG